MFSCDDDCTAGVRIVCSWICSASTVVIHVVVDDRDLLFDCTHTVHYLYSCVLTILTLFCILTPVLTQIRVHFSLVLTRVVSVRDRIGPALVVRVRVGRVLDVRISPRLYMRECVIPR